MKRAREIWRAVAHGVRCFLEVAEWVCWMAWKESEDEIRDAAGYGDGTR